VQVDPIISTLKAPETNRLSWNLINWSEVLFSMTTCAAIPRRNATGDIVGVVGVGQDMTEKRKSMATEAGAYTRPLFSST
jgi:hypothetical protein